MGANMVRSYLGETKYVIEQLSDSEKKKNPNILGRFVATLSKINEVTQNGTYYSEDLWTSVLGTPKFKEKLEKKLIMGEIDHPAEPETSIKRVSHSVIKVWPEGNELKGVCECFNTPNGQILWTLLNAGVMLGVSSRALGEEEYVHEGSKSYKKIKKEGFDLMGWDMVVDASAVGSGFREFTESKKQYVRESISKISETMREDTLCKSILSEMYKAEEEKKASVTLFENKSLKEIIRSKDELLESKSRTLQEYLGKINGLENQVTEFEAVKASTKKLLEAKEQTIRSLQENIESLNGKVSLMESEVQEKSMLIEKRTRELATIRENKKPIEYKIEVKSDSLMKQDVKKDTAVSRNMPKYKIGNGR